MTPGVGAIASGYRVVGGGGVTVSAIEVLHTSLPGSVNATPTVTTSLVPTDRVVVMSLKQNTASGPGISGLGATWNADAALTTTADTNIWSATGITGGGTITVTGLGTGPSDVIVYVLRASNGAVSSLVNAQTLPFGAAVAGTVRSTSGTAATAGSFVAAASWISVGTISLPTSSTPASGWTTDHTGSTNVKAISQTLSTGATVSVGVTSSSSFSCSLLHAIYQV
ncbi:hypothetical protein J2X63_003168 [Agromyces sp. 3263]|uniref:hypothetical protein n=1 Tax=Agromyces sp. 3263 TaxID=2817750 RepID=UPI00285845DE|nr:hypothetical protein [Agromyces sp. 3263]MDR6907460.1 hypothetical protein [Agromyces sp. 3263]